MARVAPILAELAEADVDWLLATGDRQSVPRGTVLIEAGVPAPALFVVVDGVVGIEMATPLTAQLVRRGPGELVGEMSVTTGDVLDAVNAATSRRFGLDLA